MKLVEITERTVWDDFVLNSSFGHPLQLWGWGEIKGLSAWTAYRLALVDNGKIIAGMQVLLWQIPKLGRCIVYAPRGPVSVPNDRLSAELLEAVCRWAKAHHGLYVRIEPAWTTGAPRGWVAARNYIQLPKTYTLDLRKAEEALLEPMRRKHRQYIRKAEREGVRVERSTSNNVDDMYRLYLETAKRAGFAIHSKKYYELLIYALGPQNYLFYAFAENRPVAFLWLAVAGKTAYELYGGVDDEGADMNANYTLKWEAIKTMKAANFEIYDFNGRLNDGVSRFKDGFGPDATDYIGTYDYPLSKVAYRIWEGLWPWAKRVGQGWRGFRR